MTPEPRPEAAQPNNNQTLIDDASALIQFLKERPDFPVCREHLSSSPLVFRFYQLTKEGLAAMARRMGHAKRREDERYFFFDRDFGQHFRISAFTDRSYVCRKVKVMKEVDEWECPDSVLADVPQELEEKF